jgi:hypothetical protein
MRMLHLDHRNVTLLLSSSYAVVRLLVELFTDVAYLGTEDSSPSSDNRTTLGRQPDIDGGYERLATYRRFMICAPCELIDVREVYSPLENCTPVPPGPPLMDHVHWDK